MSTVSVAIQRVDNPKIWVRVSFSLREEEYRSLQPDSNKGKPYVIYSIDLYVTYSDGFHFDIVPVDEEAAKAFEESAAECAAEGMDYVDSWAYAVMEGVHHGFKRMKLPERTIILSRLEGCLGIGGEEGISDAAMLGTVMILGGDISKIDTPGWRTTECRID